MFSFCWTLFLPHLYAWITHSCSPLVVSALMCVACSLQSLRGTFSGIGCFFTTVQLQLCPRLCLLPSVPFISLEVFSPSFCRASSNCSSFLHKCGSRHWRLPCPAAVLVQDEVSTAVSEATKSSCDWPKASQNLLHRGPSCSYRLSSQPSSYTQCSVPVASLLYHQYEWMVLSLSLDLVSHNSCSYIKNTYVGTFWLCLFIPYWIYN